MRYFRVFSQKISTQNPCRSSSFPSLGFVLSKTLTSKLTCILKVPHFASNAQPCNRISSSRDYTTSAQESKMLPSDRVLSIVNEISGLTLLEVADLTEVLKKKLNVTEMPIMAVMMPGMGFGGLKVGGKVGGAAKGEEVKAEKTAFDLKLEAFDAASKIKVIKEVRSFTDLGLKEAKDLVEKAPTVLKKGVTKEDAEKIIAKMKEIGAKVSME